MHFLLMSNWKYNVNVLKLIKNLIIKKMCETF